MIDGRNFFVQPAKNDIRIYDNIGKIATGQASDHATGCLLHYPYFKENYKLLIIALSKQQALNNNPKAVQ